MDHGYNVEHQDRIVRHHRLRRQLESEGRVHKHDGKDIAHKRAVARGGSDSKSNITIQPAHKNRGWERDGL